MSPLGEKKGFVRQYIILDELRGKQGDYRALELAQHHLKHFTPTLKGSCIGQVSFDSLALGPTVLVQLDCSYLWRPLILKSVKTFSLYTAEVKEAAAI
jgi:hypothetical protein